MSGAVAQLRGEAEADPGTLARVISAKKEVVGYGDFSPASQIRVRMLSFGPDEPGPDWLTERIAASVARRSGDPLIGETDAMRLVNAEGDGLPGLSVDRYADVSVLRFSSAGMAARREIVSDCLRELTGTSCGFERSDVASARREGIPSSEPLLWGKAPLGPVDIRERDRRFRVDIETGQKTGFYLDQRDARDLVARLSSGRRVLDVFSYTGGFAVAAARGGAARVTLVDSSQPALDRAAEHLEANAPGTEVHIHRDDAFAFLRKHGALLEPAGTLREQDGAQDLIVIDPPPLARRQGDVQRASRAYKDLLLHGIAHAAPGARILFFACSHHITPDLLGKIVFGASLDAGRPLRHLADLGAPADHPVAVDHPEGRYLTGVLLEAD